MDAVDRIFNLVDATYKEQREFAYDLGVTPSIVSQWRCRKSASYVKHISKIAKLLDTSAEYLLTGNMPKDWEKIEKEAATQMGSGFSKQIAGLIDKLPPEYQVELLSEALRMHELVEKQKNPAFPDRGESPQE